MVFLDILILCFIFALFSVAYWYLSIPRNLPPGPIGLPFIGSSLDCIDSSKVCFVLKNYAKKYGPLYKFYILDKLVIVLADYDTIQEALVKQGDAFAGRPRLRFGVPKMFDGLGIIKSEGPLWREARRFTISTLRDFGLGRPILEGRIKEETEYLNKQIAHYASCGEAFDPTLTTTFAVANIIRQLVFGKRFNYDNETFAEVFCALRKRVSSGVATVVSPFVLSETLLMLAKLTPRFRKVDETEFDDFVETEMKKVIASYDPAAEPDNYIHAYMKAYPHTVDEPEAYLQLAASVIDLFMAGTTTTSRTLCWAILFLGHNPHVQEKMYEEIKEKVGLSSLPEYGARSKLPYTEAVVTEVQRLADLAPLGVVRRCVTPTNLLGYEIPEDAIVVPLLNNVLHNPDLFPEPQRFDPGRFLDTGGKFVRNPKMIPFLAGKRICLGESLARMELFLFLTALVSRFRFFFPRHSPSPSLEPIVGFTSFPIPYVVCAEARDD